MSISFSLKNANVKSSVKTSRAQLGSDDEEDCNRYKDEDFPMTGKRKRESLSQEASQPKVIPLRSQSDWREDRKRRLGMRDKYMSEFGISEDVRDNTVEKAFTERPKEGLMLRERRSASIIREGDTTPPAADMLSRSSTPIVQESPLQEPSDADAIEAILSGESESTKRASRRVIVQPSEEDMFRHDVDTRPDGPSLNDYRSMPVEEFGAAMLRGMGWKEGMGAGRLRNGPAYAPTVERRAALLGLGAKERPMLASSDSRRPRDDSQKYVPVASRDELHRDTPKRREHDRHDRHYPYERHSRDSRHGYDRHRHRSSSHHHRHARH